jgi:hypothetical protein
MRVAAVMEILRALADLADAEHVSQESEQLTQAVNDFISSQLCSDPALCSRRTLGMNYREKRKLDDCVGPL